MQDSRVPLVIGATGHRDLVPEELPALEAIVEALLKQLKAEFPDLPLRLMTALADGADRLAARVAHGLDIPVTILLPMPEALYRSQFAEPPDELFEELLDNSEVICLPDPAATGFAVAGVDPSAMETRYAQLGVYLAAHSHILLAIWDGKDSQAAGGTSSVVRFHQQSTMDCLSGDLRRSPIDFSEDESDLVYHVVCSRRDSGAPASDYAPGDACWLSRDDVEPRTADLPDRYRRVFRQQASFNRDLDALLAAVPAGDRDSAAGEPVLREVLATHSRIDQLAQSFQRRALRSIRLTFLFIALAGVSFIAYADLPGTDPVIFTYLLFLLMAIALHRLERRNEWYRKYLDYRGLAEGIRVQYYWGLAGVAPAEATRYPHDLFTRHQDLEAGWVRNVMRFVARKVDALEQGTTPDGLERCINEWVGDAASGQIAFYEQRAQQRLKRSRLTRRLTTLSFGIGAVLALVLALFQKELADGARDLGIALMGLLPFLAAVRQSYAHRVLERELIVQYGYMARIFGNSRRLLDRSTDAAERREILRALGEASMDELATWIMRQRERPISGSQLFQLG
ncbi:MAG: hypothetical protein AAGG11_06705 [Pseudomonadota bacterium]